MKKKIIIAIIPALIFSTFLTGCSLASKKNNSESNITEEISDSIESTETEETSEIDETEQTEDNQEIKDDNFLLINKYDKTENFYANGYEFFYKENGEFSTINNNDTRKGHYLKNCLNNKTPIITVETKYDSYIFAQDTYNYLYIFNIGKDGELSLYNEFPPHDEFQSTEVANFEVEEGYLYVDLVKTIYIGESHKGMTRVRIDRYDIAHINGDEYDLIGEKFKTTIKDTEAYYDGDKITLKAGTKLEFTNIDTEYHYLSANVYDNEENPSEYKKMKLYYEEVTEMCCISDFYIGGVLEEELFENDIQ